MRLSLVVCASVFASTALAVPLNDSAESLSLQGRGFDGLFDGFNGKGQLDTASVNLPDTASLPAVTHAPEDSGVKSFIGFVTSAEATASKSKSKDAATSIPTGTAYSVIGTLPPLQTPSGTYSAFAPATPTSSDPSPTSSNQSAASRASASSSGTSEWKIIGVAVIAFTTVAGILLLSVFFDHWWRFVRDLFGRRRRGGRGADADAELVPDWEKAEWHLRFGQDRQRYPSFGSLPSIARVQPPPAAAPGPARELAAGRTRGQALGQAADMVGGSPGLQQGVGLGFGRVGSVRRDESVRRDGREPMVGGGGAVGAGQSPLLAGGQRRQEGLKNPFEDDARSVIAEDVYGGVE
ncbi:hypothetical protein PYCCODRAFT_1465928 [Trametes coccinea BRFM310]|uniref:Uncharacterized protein n=1 Tax=Trametes coccinea (strain BRFM310) TaxID=1353009 RepID=A0A1Y2IWY9_TRAC3|nr:hypothetical protein PYCCODRAFT_1465928 [Trametes coccinea BRFM310]